MYYCDNTGVELILKEDSAQKADHEEEILLALLLGLEPATF